MLTPDVLVFKEKLEEAQSNVLSKKFILSDNEY